LASGAKEPASGVSLQGLVATATTTETAANLGPTSSPLAAPAAEEEEPVLQARTPAGRRRLAAAVRPADVEDVPDPSAAPAAAAPADAPPSAAALAAPSSETAAAVNTNPAAGPGTPSPAKPARADASESPATPSSAGAEPVLQGRSGGKRRQLGSSVSPQAGGSPVGAKAPSPPAAGPASPAAASPSAESSPVIGAPPRTPAAAALRACGGGAACV
jgi:hypothetical protein